MRRNTRQWVAVGVGLALLIAIVVMTCHRFAPKPPPTSPQGQVRTTWIYQDALADSWADYTWAGAHSLSATEPVASGAHAISVTLGPWEALYFAHPGFEVKPGDTLVLKVHGGQGGANAAVRVRALIDAEQPVGVPLGAYCEGGAIQAGRWITCRVPLRLLVPEGREYLTGLWLQEDGGLALPPLFFDDVGVEHDDVTPPPPPPSEHWVAGYYTGWNLELYPPEKVDFGALTHLFVGRALPQADGSLSTQFDHDQGPQMARTLARRAHDAHRKALIMVGGAGTHDGWVGAASDAHRDAFVQALLRAVDDFGYDGLDLDWEPVLPEDRPQLMALVQALRRERPELLLTFPIHWINANFPEDADPWFAQLATYLDQVNVMSYEMIGPWEGWHSWHTSALRGEQPLHPTSIATSLEHWVKAGIPKQKLGLGIPFYGLAWRHITGPGQPFTDWSDYVGGDNDFTYKKIRELAQKGQDRWDANAEADYVTFSPENLVEDGTVTWISYDGPQAIAAKGRFLKEQGYGGVILWTVNQGCINPATGENPPLEAVRDAVLR